MASRLRRNHIAGDFSDPSSYSVNILIPNIDEEIEEKDRIDNVEYGPTINREWKFEEPVDNPEWALQTGFTKKI